MKITISSINICGNKLPTYCLLVIDKIKWSQGFLSLVFLEMDFFYAPRHLSSIFFTIIEGIKYSVNHKPIIKRKLLSLKPGKISWQKSGYISMDFLEWILL